MILWVIRLKLLHAKFVDIHKLSFNFFYVNRTIECTVKGYDIYWKILRIWNETFGKSNPIFFDKFSQHLRFSGPFKRIKLGIGLSLTLKPTKVLNSKLKTTLRNVVYVRQYTLSSSGND